MACLKVMEDGKRESSGNSLFERLTHEDAPPNRSAQAFGLLALSSHVRAQQVSTPSHISSLGLLFAALGVWKHAGVGTLDEIRSWGHVS